MEHLCVRRAQQAAAVCGWNTDAICDILCLSHYLAAHSDPSWDELVPSCQKTELAKQKVATDTN